jgi:hypothetical protein
MKIQKHTIQWRCKLWGIWAQQPRVEYERSSSVFGRIHEEQENAGIHGDGIRFEIIDGVSCRPDGGMARAVIAKGRAIAHDIRCRETAEAISCLPAQMRNAIVHTYVVPHRESPRGFAEVARRLDIDESTVREYLRVAHERIARRIYGPFEIVA